MTEVRLVIAATVIITLGLCGVMLVLNETGSLIFGVFVLFGIGLGDILGTAYIIKLVHDDQRRPRSWLLLFLATGAMFITAGFVIIEWIIIRRMLGHPPLEGTTGIVVTAIGLILMGCVPIMKAALFFVVRRSQQPNGDRIEDAA